jgi:hypothetical protein
MLDTSRSSLAVSAAFVVSLFFLNSPLALAFVTKSSHAVYRAETGLNVIPPMIIGPMIKKMRENQARKRMPMIDDSEARGQAPGLRVGGNAWKWPPIWPYDQAFFTPNEDILTPNPASQLNPMASMLSGGMPAVPPAEATESAEENDMLDVVKYWSEEKADVRTDLDEEAVSQLRR